MNFGLSSMMLIALEVKKSVVSRDWMREYLEDMKVDNSEIGDKRSYRSFRMGERTYLSEGEVRFPIVLKTDSGEYIKREVKAYMIDADRVNFLLGKETMKEWKLKIDQAEDVLVFKDKKVRLRTNREENLIAYLEMVEKWEDKDKIDLVEK